MKPDPDLTKRTPPPDQPEPTPWISASELQPAASPQGARPREQRPLDDVDEALMESFPCSDPPGYTRCHA
jgi:hypothetical protein